MSALCLQCVQLTRSYYTVLTNKQHHVSVSHPFWYASVNILQTERVKGHISHLLSTYWSLEPERLEHDQFM